MARNSSPGFQFGIVAAFAPDGIPSLVLPKKMQWLRFVPAALLWSGAAAGVVAGIAADGGLRVAIAGGRELVVRTGPVGLADTSTAT